MLRLVYEIMNITYKYPGEENVGIGMLTVSDPRLKDALYTNLLHIQDVSLEDIKPLYFCSLFRESSEIFNLDNDSKNFQGLEPRSSS